MHNKPNRRNNNPRGLKTGNGQSMHRWNHSVHSRRSQDCKLASPDPFRAFPSSTFSPTRWHSVRSTWSDMNHRPISLQIKTPPKFRWQAMAYELSFVLYCKWPTEGSQTASSKAKCFSKFCISLMRVWAKVTLSSPKNGAKPFSTWLHQLMQPARHASKLW